MFSPPRPIVFYERTSLISKERIAYFDKTKLVEIHAYLSLIQALEERLFAAIRNNELGIVFPDSFFLLSHYDLIVIVHVISLTNNSCSFECRCLEYEQTTSCHRNERTNIENIASEEKHSRKQTTSSKHHQSIMQSSDWLPCACDKCSNIS